jgi:hypothetical protein
MFCLSILDFNKRLLFLDEFALYDVVFPSSLFTFWPSHNQAHFKTKVSIIFLLKIQYKIIILRSKATIYFSEFIKSTGNISVPHIHFTVYHIFTFLAKFLAYIWLIKLKTQ